jgi:Neutral/alkaline non-lysosomal ceramidase, N-terminal
MKLYMNVFKRKKPVLLSVFASFLVLLIINSSYAADIQAVNDGWKAGVARAVITPDEPVWMAGYGSRDHPSEGTLVDLWVKVLAIEDAKGKKALLVTADILGFPKKMSDNIRNQIAVKYGLTRSQIVLSSSHTHTGPVLMDALFDIYPLDKKQIKVIRKYTVLLEKKIVDLAGEAIHSLKPAQLFSENGVTRFQVNRRNNKEATLCKQIELRGPNDYAVPVLKVTDTEGKLIAVTFGYACHATVLSFYQFSGDYPGFAQIEIEKLYPGVCAMFFQGAGADQNPLPRRTVPLAQQYGRELAAAVDRVLKEEMKELEPELKTAYSEVNLTFDTAPTKEELIKFEKEFTGYQQRWATSQLEILKNNGSLRTSYPYPVQIWKLGEQSIMVLGGELVIQYAIELKKLFGPDVFVMAYANDDMAYIPSETILEEGGYEGESSQMVYGMPAKWTSDIQNKILQEFEKLAIKAGVPMLNQ